MYLCPITKTKLIRAHAGGGLLWYSKVSKGRMVNHSMMKYFIGKNQARELFLRSKSEKISKDGLSCPSCSNPMRVVMGPKWTGGHDVEVCNSCHIFWLGEDVHPEVPAASDMIIESGDTTIVSQTIEAQAQIMMNKHVKSLSEDFSPPDDLKSKIAGLIGLPVEIHNRDDPFGLIGKILALFMGIIFIFTPENSVEFYKAVGFFPDDFFKGNGLNIITAPFIHGGVFHLIINMYFYLVFANDIEQYLGPLKFILFIFISIILTAIWMGIFSFSEDIPHIGFSGVISAIIIFYTLQFRNTKIAFAFPLFHYKVWNPKSGNAMPHISFKWIRLPIMMVLVWWIGKEVLFYFMFESSGMTSISHSGHISGYLTGFILWILLGSKSRSELV